MAQPYPNVHFDTDAAVGFTARRQHGDVTIEPDLLNRCKVYHVPYWQLRESFDAAPKPSFNDRGEAGTPWANLPLIECSAPTDLGAGLCQFTRSYVTKPSRVPELDPFTFEYQYISGTDINSASLTVPSTLSWTYYLTADSRTIPCGKVFRAIKVGALLKGNGGDRPADGVAFLAEDEKPERWKGNYWVKQTRMIPPRPLTSF